MSRVLYLGTDPQPGMLHYPVIQTVPLPIPPHVRDDFSEYTDIILTSKNGVTHFFEAFPRAVDDKRIFVIGSATAERLEDYGYKPYKTASDESQEGLIDLLKSEDLDQAYVFYPRSSLARKNLEQFLLQRHVRHQVCDLYETRFQKPLPVPDLAQIDEIIFTSPTTVRGFIEVFGSLPKDKKLTPIGPVTQTELEKQFR